MVRYKSESASQHFFGAYEHQTPGGDTIVLGVAGDPTIANGVLQPWTWAICRIESNNVDTCFDQPKLGFSDNKVMLSWNDYANANSCTDLPGSKFAGSEYVVTPCRCSDAPKPGAINYSISMLLGW